MNAAVAIVTREASCSLAECVRSWSVSCSSKSMAAAMLQDRLEKAGAVTAELGALDSDGQPICSTFCRECWAGLRAALLGAA